MYTQTFRIEAAFKTKAKSQRLSCRFSVQQLLQKLWLTGFNLIFLLSGRKHASIFLVNAEQLFDFLALPVHFLLSAGPRLLFSWAVSHAHQSGSPCATIPLDLPLFCNFTFAVKPSHKPSQVKPPEPLFGSLSCEAEAGFVRTERRLNKHEAH